MREIEEAEPPEPSAAERRDEEGIADDYGGGASDDDGRSIGWGPNRILISTLQDIKAGCGWNLQLRALGKECSRLLLKDKSMKGLCVEGLCDEGSPAMHVLLSASRPSLPSKVTEPAVCCLHKLVAGGLISGDSRKGAPQGKMNIVDRVVESVCGCGSSTSEDVQLAVLKALLTLSTSETFVVAGDRLLQAFKMMFNLAVGSNFERIRTTASASLQQLLGICFRAATAEICITPPSTPSTPTDANGAGTNGTSTSDGGAGQAKDEGANLSVGKISDLAENADISGLDRVLTSRLSVDNIELGGALASSQGGSDAQGANGEANGSSKPRGTQLYGREADLFMLLKSLCGLAARNVELSTSDMFMIEGKTLALSLIKHALHFHAWDMLSNDFVLKSRNLLCVMLIRNANSPFKLAAVREIEIFTLAVLQPRILAAMKPEFGAFMPLLMLQNLEVFSPRPHLLITSLTSLHAMCEQEQLLVDLFVNYDCEIDATNVFERIVKGLCYVLTSSHLEQSAEFSSTVKKLAARNLYTILSSLQRWFSDHDDYEGDGDNSERGAGGGGGGGGSPMSQGQQIVAAKTRKNTLVDGIDLFNKDPVKGMKTLIARGAVEDDVEAQAKFLHSTQDLDKSAKGQFLGHHGSNSISVMHSYTDVFDFTGLDFDGALRLYLSTFRLPGEAQQIDRLMEKFADRFCTCNEGIFFSADQAYTLAYAVIMLNTDMHNPLAEHLMSKDDFVGMVNQCPLEGADEAEDTALPVEYLESIFDRIAANEIQISGVGEKAEDGGKARSLSNQLLKVLQKALPYEKSYSDSNAANLQTSLNHAKDVLKRRNKESKHSASDWTVASNRDIALLMVDVFLKHVMPLLRNINAGKIPSVLNKGIARCVGKGVIIAALTDQHAYSEELMSMLAGYVRSDEAQTIQVPNELRIECLRVLLGLTLDYPELLQGSWTHVFRCVSSVQYLALRGSDSAGVGGGNEGDGRSKSAFVTYIEEDGMQRIDKLFSGSASFDGQTIVLFITAMCAVNREELESSTIPALKFILLQRLVETIHHNLDRIRMVWSRIWSVTSAHLVSTGCEEDVEISIYSIDALRQIVHKLLQHKELSNFKYQEEALKPFMQILRQTELEQSLTFAVQCIHQIVVAHLPRLQSGWRCILSAIQVALAKGTVEIVELALLVLNLAWCQPKIVSNDDLFDALGECSVSVMSTSNHVEHQNRAISMIREGALKLALSDESENGQLIKMLGVLSRMGNTALSHSKSCYHGAYQALFDLLESSTLSFTTRAMWEEIAVSVLKPVLVVTCTGVDATMDEYFRTYIPRMCQLLTCEHMYHVDLVLKSLMEGMQTLLFRNLPVSLEAFVVSQLSEIGMALTSRSAEGQVLDLYLSSLASINDGMESELSRCDGIEDLHRCAEKALKFQQTLSIICACMSDQHEHQTRCLSILESTVLYAMRFNNEASREHKDALCYESQGSYLVRQEVEGGCFYARLLGKLCDMTKDGAKPGDEARMGHYETMLFSFCNRAIEVACDEAAFAHGSWKSRAPLTALLLACYAKLPDRMLMSSTRSLVHSIPHMIISDDLPVRVAVSDLLNAKFKSLCVNGAGPGAKG